MDTKKIFKHIPWVILGIIGAFCLAVVALRRGEHVSALWIVVASVSVYLVAYRYYSLYIAQKVMKLDPTRATPAVINNDGLNYVPTNRYVLFGHHFAAIAGAGPLVGPVLAAQMGYLPGTLWLLAGVVLAGAPQQGQNGRRLHLHPGRGRELVRSGGRQAPAGGRGAGGRRLGAHPGREPARRRAAAARGLPGARHGRRGRRAVRPVGAGIF